MLVRYSVVATFVAVCGTLWAGCGSGGSSDDATGDAKYPTFQEGGTMSFTVQGKPVSVKVDFVDLANTDSGVPDYLEITGPGMYLCALIDPKMPDVEGDGYYKPMVGRALSFKVPADLLPTPREITIPNQGKYPVTGGSLTMEKFQVGMEGRDKWDGKIELTLQTAQGPVPLSGTFSFCVVPTW